MSALDVAAALEAVRLGEATGEHAEVLAFALHDALVKAQSDAHARLEADMGEAMVAVLYAQRDAARAELATVRAERDRLCAVVAQAEACDRLADDPGDDEAADYLAATTATEALARELRGAR